jgi:hypothetical protein
MTFNCSTAIFSQITSLVQTIDLTLATGIILIGYYPIFPVNGYKIFYQDFIFLCRVSRNSLKFTVSL